MSVPTTLVWFRQDLRTDDQPALQAAARSGRPLLGLYVWPNEGTLTARRRYFIWQSLRDLQAITRAGGRPVLVLTGKGKKTLAKEKDRLPENTLVFDDLLAFSQYLREQDKPA